MSVLPSRADIVRPPRHVRFVPEPVKLGTVPVHLRLRPVERASPSAACLPPDVAQRPFATLEDSSWRTATEYRPPVVLPTCATLFRFASAPLLPLYLQGGSGQTTDAANG